jgi:hypothetical protein
MAAQPIAGTERAVTTGFQVGVLTEAALMGKRGGLRPEGKRHRRPPDSERYRLRLGCATMCE